MLRSELIDALASRFPQLTQTDADLVVREIIDAMSQVLVRGQRVEIRGFGSFALVYRAPRTGRNPKTGTEVAVRGKFVPHFRPGKELRNRAAASAGVSEHQRNIA
jgi:integration host factor subunit beta